MLKKAARIQPHAADSLGKVTCANMRPCIRSGVIGKGIVGYTRGGSRITSIRRTLIT